MNNETLLLVFVALTGAAVLLQAVVLLALFVTLRKSVKSLGEQVDELRSKALPVLTDVKEYLDRVGPRIESVAKDLESVAHGLRAQSTEMQVVATEMMDRVRRQSSRIDHMFSGVLDSAEKAGNIVSDVVTVPLRQLAAIAASVRAVVTTLATKPVSEPRETHSAADKEMFV